MPHFVRSLLRAALAAIVLALEPAALGAAPVVEAVDCIGLTVSDADRSADFYTRVLEFRRERETEVAG